MRRVRAATLITALTLTTVLATTSCSLVAGGDDEPAGTAASGPGGPGGESGGTVVMVTHSDFALPRAVRRAFERESGYDLEVRQSNGVGDLVNLVVDEAGNPSGDVVFGVDNTFGSRVLGSEALAPYDGPPVNGTGVYDLPGDDEHRLVPVDTGDVCVNVDEDWFAEAGIEPPATLEDLIDPAYRDLFVTPGASTSSPGLAFLLTTIAEYGDDWPDYWERLLDNGAEVVPGWSEAYYTEFTQGEGDRPIVLSYSSSPAFTVDDGDRGAATSRTRALLETCYLQVEYAGVLAGTDNPAGAQALVEFLQGEQVQQALPTSMYVFPAVPGTEVPPDWARFAERPEDPYAVDPAEVEANREDWLLEWTDLLAR